MHSTNNIYELYGDDGEHADWGSEITQRVASAFARGFCNRLITDGIGANRDIAIYSASANNGIYETNIAYELPNAFKGTGRNFTVVAGDFMRREEQIILPNGTQIKTILPRENVVPPPVDLAPNVRYMYVVGDAHDSFLSPQSMDVVLDRKGALWHAYDEISKSIELDFIKTPIDTSLLLQQINDQIKYLKNIIMQYGKVLKPNGKLYLDLVGYAAYIYAEYPGGTLDVENTAQQGLSHFSNKTSIQVPNLSDIFREAGFTRTMYGARQLLDPKKQFTFPEYLVSFTKTVDPSTHAMVNSIR